MQAGGQAARPEIEESAAGPEAVAAAEHAMGFSRGGSRNMSVEDMVDEQMEQFASNVHGVSWNGVGV